MRHFAQMIVAISALATLTACAGSTTGKEMGIGIGAMDTISKDEQENEDWFGSFYGKKHCVWGSGCAGGANKTEGSGGGVWGTPSDVGHSDSGAGY